MANRYPSKIFKTTAADRAAIGEALGPYFPSPIYGYVINTADDGREVISLIEGPMYKSSDSDPKYCVLSPNGYQQETCHNLNFWTLAEIKGHSYANRCEGDLDSCDCDTMPEDRLGKWPFTLEAQA
tara:strand:+ start:108 stop:485 length:378 start_codon:yes stop_codon:yes gene_type:complete